MIDSLDQNSVDLKELRALVAVADRGSFRAAAKSLGYTQSAISHQIAALERALQAPMFTGPMEVSYVDGTGHFLHREKPDDVSKLIVDWLAG